MSDTKHAPRWKRLLDGGRTWGSVDVSPTRHGVTRYRLVVFPPGISAEDRMLLRAWRSWPVWGLSAWLALEVTLIPTLGAGQALTISTATFLGSGAVVMAMTGANRSAVRTLSVIRMAGARDRIAAQRFAEMKTLAGLLAAADNGLAEGDLDSVEHEAEVWRVYDRLAAAQFVG